MTLSSFIFRKFVFTSRSIKSKGVWLSLTGLFLASFLVFLTLGILSGYQNVYKSAVLNFSAHVIVHHPFGLEQNKVDRIQEFLKTKPGTVSSPYYFYETLAPTQKGFQPVIFKAIDFTVKDQVYPVTYKLNHDEGVILGHAWQTLQPQTLKTKQLSFVQTQSGQKDGARLLKTIPVQGEFETGYYDFDSKFALMDLSLFKKTFQPQSGFDGLEIRLADADQAQMFKSLLLQQFPNQFDVLTWDEMNLQLFEALKLEKTVVFLISFFVLLVASLNLFGLNYLFIKSRQSEFQILLQLGYAKNKVLKLMGRASFYVALVAVFFSSFVAFGFLFWLKQAKGIALDLTVYLVDHIPADFPWIWFVLYALVSLILSQAAALWAGQVVIKRYQSDS